MGKITTGAGKVYKGVCVAIISMMVLIVFTNTLLRYGFNSGIVQAEEILRYLFIWLTFLGIVAVYKDNEHISVTILTERLSPKAAAVLSLLANLLALGAFGVLIKGSLAYMEESASTVGQLTGLPFRFIIAAILFAALGCALLVVRDILRAARTISRNGQGG